MKVIIAGSRTCVEISHVEEAIKAAGFDITEAVSGTARGVDTLGERWAQLHGIPIKRIPADWPKYGKRAGFIRNGEMAKYADALIAIWDGESRGTGHMIALTENRGLKVHVYYFR
jgi:hypothetical protein